MELSVWKGWSAPASSMMQNGEEVPFWPAIHVSRLSAEQLFAQEALNPHAVKSMKDQGVEPYTLQWFLNIEHQRYRRHGSWVPRLLEFSKHHGETLLGLGQGLGTDWLQYTYHGASIIACNPSKDQLALVRRNFELRGLSARFLHARAENLPLVNASIDVVCLSTLSAEVEERSAQVQEIYRVLKPGGKVLALLPAHFNAGYWSGLVFPWRTWPQSPLPESDEPAFKARELRRLFGQFIEHRIHKRHLRRREIPHLWRWAPLAVLERLMGRMLVLKAFKPLSTAISVQAAA
jgi:ubiquinone/menaquinone biosynthesis C-methylase UbiE